MTSQGTAHGRFQRAINRRTFSRRKRRREKWEAHTFDFSVSWTCAQDATLYVLDAAIYEFPTFWAFTSKGFPDRPGGGGVTLSFSATDIPVGIFISSSGSFLITHIPFTVRAFSPIHGEASSNTVIGVVDTT
jgi:hypothetical protein